MVLFSLSSCSLENRMERKFNQAQRKVEKLTIRWPRLLQKDTIRDSVIVYVPQISHDTSFLLIPGDTVTITKDRLTMKYVQIGDTVFLQGTCKADTIIQQIEIPFEHIVIQKQTFFDALKKNTRIAVVWLMILIAITIGARFAWKVFKPLP